MFYNTLLTYSALNYSLVILNYKNAAVRTAARNKLMRKMAQAKIESSDCNTDDSVYCLSKCFKNNRYLKYRDIAQFDKKIIKYNPFPGEKIIKVIRFRRRLIYLGETFHAKHKLSYEKETVFPCYSPYGERVAFNYSVIPNAYYGIKMYIYDDTCQIEILKNEGPAKISVRMYLECQETLKPDEIDALFLSSKIAATQMAPVYKPLYPIKS